MHPSILKWKEDLRRLYTYYERKRPKMIKFFPLLFLFFIIINVLCYWLAMATAFNDLLYGSSFWYYFKVQFPVGIMGALFDSLSFFVTLYIVRKALGSMRDATFIGHLSIDLVIAFLATMWVLFVFSFSGWLISLTEPASEVLADRNAMYQKRVVSAVQQPTKNLRNIYFGLIMGISAMLPTTIHLIMAFRSFVLKRRYVSGKNTG